VFTVFLQIKTRNFSLSVLFAAITAVIYMTANQIIEPFIPAAFMPESARFALVELLTFIISYAIGRVLKPRLNSLADSTPKGGIVRYIIGGTLITLALFYVNIFMIEQLGRVRVVAVTSMLLAGYMVFLIAAVHAFVQSRNELTEMENLKKYTAQIEAMNYELRHFKHDHVNILSSLYGYAQNNDLASLRSYLQEQLMPYSRGIALPAAPLAQLANVKIPELKGLLSVKAINAGNLGVEISFEVPSPVDEIHMNTVDLCRVAGILLDNAIEASSNRKDGVRVMLSSDGYGATLAVANKVDVPLDLSLIFKKGYTTKEKAEHGGTANPKRGLGLYNLRIILGCYENAAINAANDGGEAVFKLEVGSC
jgi:two-component system sensor histidine kinase AgrC